MIIIFVKRFWPWLSAGLVVLIMFLLLAPYLFRAWTKYPEPMKTEIAWRQFVATFEGVCREGCLASRQAYADIWRPYHLTHPEDAMRDYAEAFKTDNEELQRALIKIMAADLGRNALPTVLAEVIADPERSDELKRKIVVAFPEAFADEDWLSGLRFRASDAQLDESERVYAIGLLAAYPEEMNFKLIKELLSHPNNEAVALAALQTASVWPTEAIVWSDEEAAALESLLRQDAKPIRWRRLWMMTEKGNGEERMLKERLTRISNDTGLDDITRGLAAESLRTQFQINIITPEPSAEDWQEYYENI